MKETRTMKRILLAGASALVLVAAMLPAPAAAQGITVYDNANLVSRGLQHTETLRQWATQARDMERQYGQLRSTFEAIAHTNSVSGLASNLGGLANTIPGAGEVSGLLRGVGSIGNAGAILQGNRVFSATGSDFSATELHRRAQGLANIQALAYRQMQASEQRALGLQELLEEIDGQPDLQASAALGNRIASEQTFLAAQQQQLAQLQIMQRSQEQVDVLRVEERQRRDAEAYRDSLQPLGPE